MLPLKEEEEEEEDCVERTLRRKRKLSKNSEESNVKYFRFEFEDDSEEKRNNFKTPTEGKEQVQDSPDGEDNSEHELCCTNCSAKFDTLSLLNDHQCSKFMPQLVGYKCPECNKTFQSFLSIAEHKEQSDCKRFLPILPAPPSKENAMDHFPSLTRSEFFHLYPTETSQRKGNVSTKLKEKTGFSRSSICFLQVHYKHDNYPSPKEIELMSKRLGIERHKVDLWFQKQRNRERKKRALGLFFFFNVCLHA